MEPGQYQMQIALSLIVILGAALVALLCDLLKGNNEQLRELALELKVRCEETNKRFQMLSPHAPAVSEAPARTAAPWMTERFGMQSFRTAQAGPSRPSMALETGEDTSPKPRRAPDRVPTERRSIDLPVQRGEPMMRGPVVARMEAPASPSPAPKAAEKFAGPSRDWISVLNAGRQSGAAHRTRLQQRDLGAPRTEPALPAGFQDGFVLARLMESRQPIGGLVVSIGVSGSQDANCSLPESVRALIQSLMGSVDFAVQSAADEFLLICPGERGTSVHRRLTHIAEQLWDFQLRSTGGLSILLSWGAVEVYGEPMDEAIASATERMQETRRNRRVLSMGPRQGPDGRIRRATS
jgi:hypothetical protein